MAEGKIEDTNIGNDGGKTDEIDFVNLFELKIKEQGLSKILEGFKNVDMSIHDILYCNEDDIRDIIKSSPGIKISPIERVKFIRIVMSIKAMKEGKGANATQKDADSYLGRMLRLNGDNKVDAKRIIAFVDSNKQQDLERILEIIADETNNVHLKRIFDFVDKYPKSSDIHRVFAIGYDAMIAYEKIHQFKNEATDTVDKDEYIKAVGNNINKQKTKLNEECQWMKNEIDILQKIAVQQIEFQRDLIIRDINEYQNVDCKKEAGILLNRYFEYLETQNRDKMNAISSKIDAIKSQTKSKPPKKSSKFKFVRNNINKLWTLTHEPVRTALSFKGAKLSLKCQGINGSKVSLEWTPAKPWEDQGNTVFAKLIEMKQFKKENISIVIEYTEDEEQKHEDTKWKQITVRKTKKKEWGNKCQICLDCDKAYKMRIKYAYSGYGRGSSEFSSVISIKTGPGLEGIDPYEPLWSDTFIGKDNMELSQNNTVVTCTKEWRSVRAKFEITKGTKIMWEFKLNNNGGLEYDTIFGVYCQKATDDDGKETDNAFQAQENAQLTDLHGIRTNTVNGFWINVFDTSDKGVNNVRIIADYTKEKCILSFIVNAFVPMVKGKPYVLELNKLEKGEALYPAMQFYRKGSCKIQSVSL